MIGTVALACSVFSLEPIPTLDPSQLKTIVANTYVAAMTQTSSAGPATDTPVPASTYPPNDTSEPTLTVPASPTPIPVTVPGDPDVSCIPANPPQTGTVVEVVDGDTIKVLLDQDGQTYSLRYIGIDTPENTTQVEYFGAEASARNSELVYGKNVTLIKDVSETDRFGRLLRYVFVGTTFINYELVNQGYATALFYSPDTACAPLFDQAEANARARSLGMWSVQITQPTQPSAAGSLTILAVNKSDEYVDIQNAGSTPVSLSGWTLLSERGNQSCALDGTIQPGEVLRIWSGTGQSGFSCGYESPIWNNSETDPAVLLNPQGQEIDRYP